MFVRPRLDQYRSYRATRHRGLWSICRNSGEKREMGGNATKRVAADAHFPTWTENLGVTHKSINIPRP